MKNLIVFGALFMTGLAGANPLQFPSYLQTVRVQFERTKDAKAAEMKVTPLPGGAELAFTSRWDDSTPAHVAKARMLHDIGYKATFFLNANPNFFRNCAPQILAWGHAVGNHSSTHPFLMECLPNRIFREIYAQKIAIECETGFSVVSFAAPFNWVAPVDKSQPKLLGKILLDTGHFTSSDYRVADTGLTGDQWYCTYLFGADDRNPNEKQFEQRIARSIASAQSHPDYPRITFGIHSWCDEAGTQRQAEWLKRYRNRNWFYGNDNEYGAYRYSFLHGTVKKVAVEGKEAVFTVVRFSPAQLGDLIPLSLSFSRNVASVSEKTGGALAAGKNGTWTLPHRAGLALPSVIDCVKEQGPGRRIPNVAMSVMPDEKAGVLTVSLENRGTAPMQDLYLVAQTPPRWEKGRICEQIPELAPGVKIEKRFSLGKAVTLPGYTEGNALYGASVDYCSGGKTFRLYATKEMPGQTGVKGSSPRDTVLTLGPFAEEKFEETTWLAASQVGAPLPDLSEAVNEKWQHWTDPDRVVLTCYAFMPYGSKCNAAYKKAITPIVESKKQARLIAFEFEAPSAGEAKFYNSVHSGFRKPCFYLNGVKYALSEKKPQRIPVLAGKNRLILRADMEQVRAPSSVQATVSADGLDTPFLFTKIR